MHLRRVMMTWMLVLLAMACLAPALAVADGPSAGDQQYTDPLGGSNSSGSKTTSTSSGSSSSNSTPSSSSSSSASQSSSAPAVPSGSSSTPVATTAVSSSSSTTSTTSALPRTGFDLWLGAGFGVVLLGAGVTLRRRAHYTE